MSLTKTEIAYIAGLFDGEGNVSIYKRQRKARTPEFVLSCVVTNTNRAVIGWLLRLFGGGVTTYFRNGCKPRFQWRQRSRRGEALLKLLLPYLIIKRPQAELALQFRKTFIGNNLGRGVTLADNLIEVREKARLKLMELNKRG